MKKVLGFVGILVVLIGFAGVGWSANLYVPSQYSTIQGAINAAEIFLDKSS
ncbi:MAG: hypothetical protein QMD92_08250 [bacterium]|nr:hypothetical protein [bacterium]